MCRYKNVYAVTGDSLNQFNNVLKNKTVFNGFIVRHEEAGAFAAATDAELTGLACFADSSGPGPVQYDYTNQ